MVSIELTDLQREIERRIAENAESGHIQLTRNGAVVGMIQFLGAVPPATSTRPSVPGVAPVDTSELFEPLPDDLLAHFHSNGL